MEYNRNKHFKNRIQVALRGTAPVNEDQQDNGTAVHQPGLFWHVVSHDVFSQLPWSERLEVILQKRGKSKEECEAAFLRSCGPAICTASVPHGPLIKDREDMMATSSFSTSSLSLCLSSFCLTHPSLALYQPLCCSLAFLPSLLSFTPLTNLQRGLPPVTDVNRWMCSSFCHYSDQMCIVYMSVNFNESSFKWPIHVEQ